MKVFTKIAVRCLSGNCVYVLFLAL